MPGKKFALSIAAGLMAVCLPAFSQEKQYLKEPDPTGLWVPVLTGSLAGLVYVRFKNRTAYQMRGAPSRLTHSKQSN
jgi:hypothetical protein